MINTAHVAGYLTVSISVLLVSISQVMIQYTLNGLKELQKTYKDKHKISLLF